QVRRRRLGGGGRVLRGGGQLFAQLRDLGAQGRELRLLGVELPLQPPALGTRSSCALSHDLYSIARQNARLYYHERLPTNQTKFAFAGLLRSTQQRLETDDLLPQV